MVAAKGLPGLPQDESLPIPIVFLASRYPPKTIQVRNAGRRDRELPSSTKFGCTLPSHRPTYRTRMPSVHATQVRVPPLVHDILESNAEQNSAGQAQRISLGKVFAG